MAPIHSRAVESLKPVFTLGTRATTSDRAKGSAVAPTSRKRCPNAYTRLPSMWVTVPSAATLKSPATSWTLIIDPGLRSAGLPMPGSILAPAVTGWRGSRAGGRKCGGEGGGGGGGEGPEGGGGGGVVIRGGPRGEGAGGGGGGGG